MKNNKLLAGLACGVIIGSIGTSLIGNYQSQGQTANTNDTKRVENSTDSTVANSNTSNYTSSDGAPPFNGGQGDRGGKGHHKGQGSLEASESIDVASGQYSDGTYEGEATAFGGALKVEVTISNTAISNIEVTSHSETPGFYEKAFETVPAEIIQSQSTDVDTVSGATYSSVGIINAVNDALSSASSTN